MTRTDIDRQELLRTARASRERQRELALLRLEQARGDAVLDARLRERRRVEFVEVAAFI